MNWKTVSFANNSQQAVTDAFNENLISLGEKEIKKNSASLGSLDMGNVSYAVPSIHPWLGIGEPALALHTKEFADCAVSETKLSESQVLFRQKAAIMQTQ